MLSADQALLASVKWSRLADSLSTGCVTQYGGRVNSGISESTEEIIPLHLGPSLFVRTGLTVRHVVTEVSHPCCWNKQATPNCWSQWNVMDFSSDALEVYHCCGFQWLPEVIQGFFMSCRSNRSCFFLFFMVTWPFKTHFGHGGETSLLHIISSIIFKNRMASLNLGVIFTQPIREHMLYLERPGHVSVFRRPRTEILTLISVPKPKNNPSLEYSTSQRSPQLQNWLPFLHSPVFFHQPPLFRLLGLYFVQARSDVKFLSF